ncbi:STAS domain-containing protein [Methanoregula sp.]|uniref:STAS domain-containing protein n=1 Tax=Methanoregula sp. TaxID=2052170 RepID=UPI002CFEC186|nr:STAS domain-containing protein [Methanoregula sp.]HVP95963.1 STAS domain-containing protein [Methanoregula sp.]
MDIDTTIHDATAVLSITGRVDAMTAGELEGAINGRIERGDRKIILDFTGLAYISSGGLRVLLATAKKLHNEGDRFALCGLSVEVQKIMNLAGFTAIFSIYTTASDALAAEKETKISRQT